MMMSGGFPGDSSHGVQRDEGFRREHSERMREGFDLHR